MELSTLLQLHIDTPLKKRTPEYGLQISKALHAQVKGNAYFTTRNERIIRNRKVAKGEQDMQAYKDMLRVEGNQSFINIDWSAPKIAPRFLENVIATFLEYDEETIVEAIDDTTVGRKQQERLDAMFRMKQQQKIQAFQQATGINFEGDQYTPQNDDELEAWFEECRTPEEILFEEECGYICAINDYKQLKRRILREVCIAGMAFTEQYTDHNGNERIKVPKTELMVHNLFETDNGKDELQYIGKLHNYKIIDIRRKYNLDEQKLFELANRSAQTKGQSVFQWQDSYATSLTRPYDDFTVPCFDYYIKTVDTNYAVIRTDNFGNQHLNDKASKPVYDENKNPNTQPVTDTKYNMYHGVWVVDTETMLEWGLMKNMIKPYQDTDECLFPYSVIIPNNDGALPTSLLDKASTPIKMLTLTHLKIMQLMAELKPAGAAIDISKCRDIDLGLGGSLNVFDLQRIYMQKGIWYYDSDGDDPDRPKNIPITELANAADVAKLNELVNLYNFWSNKLESETGVNSILSGTGIKPRMNEQSIETGIQAGTNSIQYIYDGFISIMNETMDKVCIKLWDKIMFKAEQYKKYQGYDVSDMEFSAKVKMSSNKEAKQRLEQKIQTALAAGTLDFKDAFKISEIKNPKLAGIYLDRALDKKRQEAQEDAKMQSDYNANVQVKSMQAKAQADMQKAEFDAQVQSAIQQQTGENTKQNTLLTYALQMQLKALETGVALPANAQQLVDYVIGNVVGKQVQQDQQEQAAQEQAAQQEQQQPQAA